MKKILISLIAILGVTASFAQRPQQGRIIVENPLRVAVAGVTHDHLSGVTSRARRDRQVL